MDPHQAKQASVNAAEAAIATHGQVRETAPMIRSPTGMQVCRSATLQTYNSPDLQLPSRAVIKVRGTRVAVGKQSAKIANAKIIARNPRHRIRWTAPSQQGHHADAVAHSTLTTA